MTCDLRWTLTSREQQVILPDLLLSDHARSITIGDPRTTVEYFPVIFCPYFLEQQQRQKKFLSDPLYIGKL